MVASPRAAAGAAAMARASAAAGRIDLGASIPAKTLVEHKAENGLKNVSGKGTVGVNLSVQCPA